MDQSGKGRVVVITGASAGIGAALARRLGSDGYRLVLAARGRDALAQVAADAAPSGNAFAVPTDVTQRKEVERLRDRALEHFGGVDVWVNNAGRGIARPVLELTDDDVDQMMSVNLKSALYGMQAIAPHFIERDAGHIVNVSSYLSRVPAAPLRAAYSAAKAALNTLTANLRDDLRTCAPHVHVSLVMPGMVATDFARNAVAGGSGGGGGGAGGNPGAPNARPVAVGGTQTAPAVADAIAQLLTSPVAEVYTNPTHPALVMKYFQDVGAFR